MSLRYTGEATMDEPALRDVERWKDKIEVRLDNRQVFFLFFGSAMVACMLFVLGVIVGKRLETRGRAEAPAIEDPLAVLDRFAVTAPASPPAALTFQHALIGAGASKTKPTLSTTVPVTPPLAPAPIASTMTAPEPRTTRTMPATPAPPTTPVTPTAVAVASTPAAADLRAAKASSAAAARLAALPRPLSSPGSPAREAIPAARGTTAASAVKPTPATTPASAAVAVDKPKGHFLLQLSSFQDRGDADAFARRFAAQNAYVVATEIAGKGTWYRVRVGSFGTLQEATAAKAAFEHDHNVIAYVAGAGPAR